MPPRVGLQAVRIRSAIPTSRPYICSQCRHASSAPTSEHITAAMAPYAASQPPSHKRPEFRKSQLHRQYQSTLHSSPLILVFQHNNLKSVEWMGIRRELALALRKVDAELASKEGNTAYICDSVKISVVDTGIFASALKVVEFWEPKFELARGPAEYVTHGLSRPAWQMAKSRSRKAQHGLEALLSGPLALLTFPEVSPAHLKAALSILAPSDDFPAPRRRANPSYHEPRVQAGLQKLMLLGVRVEGRVYDVQGARWVGGIEGGITGLRAQVVALLGGICAGITSTLEAAGRSLYITMESRKAALEDKAEGMDGG